MINYLYVSCFVISQLNSISSVEILIMIAAKHFTLVVRSGGVEMQLYLLY